MIGRKSIGENAESERGQVYTLEGFAAAAVVLFALLFAIQAVVIAPGSGGAVDRTAQAQTQQEVQDALVVAAYADDGDGSLSELVRYWANREDFESHNVEDHFVEYFVLGEILDSHFTGSGTGDRYGVEFVYLNESEPENVGLVGSSTNDPTAVTASYTATIYEGQNVTKLDNGAVVEKTENAEIEDETYSRLPSAETGSNPVHNVVEVRVTVW
ncbi:DUF7288 family protein [Natrarchaeobius oligotrophus]|uniref:Uncharacterized protein n=1 Tax=Natrarchaeobius chitinivorans TaxID=1679083 RepID=A0A3N6MFG4_NATCH|nr:hypothetical protein [Natrarchaeobius chitinivorans]RQG99674.1 hypothetical protein EA472_13540 [Natrarchaeobius chitinivorans]